MSTTPVDLLLLAGLPSSLHKRIEAILKELAGPSAKVVAVPSASHDGPLYRSSVVQTLLRAAGQFSIRRLQNRGADQPPRPRRIVLFYVPSSDDHQLLNAFDFFVFPIPLRGLAEFDEVGHQKRHDRLTCEGAVRLALEIYSLELITWIQPRIESRKSTEPLLLPPRNFHLPHRKIRDFFLELTRRTQSWENAFPEHTAAEIFEFEQLPGFLDRAERKAMFRDARNVIFPCARATQLHWRVPDLGPESDLTLLQDFLRSTYRFGTPVPDGFHHDAQLEWGADFDEMPFDCSREGAIRVSGKHANIYPNDFVKSGR